MTEAYLTKLPNGLLAPASEDDGEILRKFKIGDPVKVTLTKPRNYQFHKKWFALVNFAFSYWEPPELKPDPEEKWRKAIRPQKNFDRFRKDITILAGFYDSTFRLDGSVRIEAKSISFASMSEEEFEKLYDKTINVILEKVTPQYSEDQLREIVDQVLGFV